MAVASRNSDLHGYGPAIRRELRKRIPRDVMLRALDVGTGFGINAAFLVKRLKKGSEVWTVDPSEDVLEKVKEQMGRELAGVSFMRATADDLGFDEGHFDLVVSVMVLHHIEKLRPALREMARVLKRGGSLLIVDYGPSAAGRLEFTSRHPAEDFFTPEQVSAGLASVGIGARATDNGVWYLVEARKPSVPRRPPARGRARGGRGR